MYNRTDTSATSVTKPKVTNAMIGSYVSVKINNDANKNNNNNKKQNDNT